MIKKLICLFWGHKVVVRARDLILTQEQKVYRFRQIFACPPHRQIRTMTIDQKDPNAGYTERNIVKCCWICNFIKGGILTFDQMLLIGPSIRKELMALCDSKRRCSDANRSGNCAIRPEGCLGT